jgi:mannose-6-phosphate isomerase-like protein (cupin superfamily)
MERFYKGTLEKDYQDSVEAKHGQEWLIGNFEKFAGTPRRTGHLEFKYWKIKDTTQHKAKMQKTVAEVTIVLKGRIEGFVGEQRVVITEGEYIYIPPNTINNLVEKASDGAEGFTIKAPSDPMDCIKYG